VSQLGMLEPSPPMEPQTLEAEPWKIQTSDAPRNEVKMVLNDQDQDPTAQDHGTPSGPQMIATDQEALKEGEAAKLLEYSGIVTDASPHCDFAKVALVAQDLDKILNVSKVSRQLESLHPASPSNSWIELGEPKDVTSLLFADAVVHPSTSSAASKASQLSLEKITSQYKLPRFQLQGADSGILTQESIDTCLRRSLSAPGRMTRCYAGTFPCMCGNWTSPSQGRTVCKFPCRGSQCTHAIEDPSGMKPRCTRCHSQRCTELFTHFQDGIWKRWKRKRNGLSANDEARQHERAARHDWWNARCHTKAWNHMKQVVIPGQQAEHDAYVQRAFANGSAPQTYIIGSILQSEVLQGYAIGSSTAKLAHEGRQSRRRRPQH